MAAGHQLKKLSQSRQSCGSKCIDCLPKQWSAYTVLFCAASLVMFCILFYDIGASPTSLRLHANKEGGSLRAQAGDSSALVASRSSPTEVITVDKVLADLKTNSESSDQEVTDTESTLDVESSIYKKIQDPSEELGKEESKPAELSTFKTLLDDEPPENDGSPDDVGEGNAETIELKTKIERGEDAPFEEVELLDLEGNPLTSKEKTESENEESTDVVDSEEMVEEREREESGETTVSEELIEDPVDLEVARPESKEVNGDDVEFMDEEVPSDHEEQDDEPKLDGKKSTDSTIQLAEFGTEWTVDRNCDFTKGKWVYDEDYPIYKPKTCALLDGGFRCVENGRPNTEFQKYRWQPSGCNLPKFNPKMYLERMRGSRMVFVGDSIGRNNWESMLCMLAEGVENKSRIYEMNGESITKHSGFLRFYYEDYNCTVEYYRSPYLVPQGSTTVKTDSKVPVRSTLKLDVIDWSANKWVDADIVIFNSGHWWSYGKTIRGGNFFQEGRNVHLNMSVHDAFERAMQTVARFVEKRMDAKKTQVFFRSYAPVHFRGGTWDHGGTCNSDTKPLTKFPFVYEDRSSGPMVSRVMRTNLKNPITFVNVTYLSDLRPDGHSSIWQRVPNSPKNHQDCSHWCLPGVPDTWNEIILAKLLIKGQGRWGKSNAELSAG